MRRRLFVAVVLATIAMAACSSSKTARRSSQSTTSGGTESAPTSSAAGGGAQDWPVYHGDPTHRGSGPAGPDPARLRQVWASEPLDGDIYAEPLFVGDEVLVATERNTVYALDAGTGTLRWQEHLGEPIPRSQLPCGNIDPSGITSTPVVDTARGTVDVVMFAQPGRHELDALDLRTGAVQFHRIIDPPGSDPLVQQQRSALVIGGDRVYVGFGGLFGDCGDYRGYVIGMRTDGTGDPLVFQAAPRGVAVWAPSGPAVAPDGSLLISTGNAVGGGNPRFANTVVRLSPSLQPVDVFTPDNQAELSRADVDLGSVGPAVLGSRLVFQIGKEGVGYLLRADRLAEAVFKTQVCDSGAYGGTAYGPPLLYVPCRDGVYALRIGTDRFDVAWRATGITAGSPIVTGDTVWAIDTQRGDLRAFDARTGAERLKQSIGPVAHFVTPTLAAGRIVVATSGRVLAFGN